MAYIRCLFRRKKGKVLSKLKTKRGFGFMTGTATILRILNPSLHTDRTNKIRDTIVSKCPVK